MHNLVLTKNTAWISKHIANTLSENPFELFELLDVLSFF